MRNIRLLDGTVYPVDRCGADGGVLRIRILPPFVIADVAARFTDPAKTAKIEHYFDGVETDHVIYEHYTVFQSMEADNGKLLLWMKQTNQSEGG